MITGIRFGGLHTPPPKPKPRVAPLPEEYKQQIQVLAIKNIAPKPVN